jgi:serine phosphatase RsbU (regulator of sigma subunit)/anti-sigma regulatory factor (Ser/Thr protein kinase)
MTTRIRNFWQNLRGQSRAEIQTHVLTPDDPPKQDFDSGILIAPDDPLLAYFQSAPGAIEIDKINLDSIGLQHLIRAGIKLVVPLISQGELIGLLNLGARRSEQEYSVDDQRLLNNLASQAAPALRVAQLVRQQQVEARERERLEQELRVARIIQETLLPKSVPEIAGWQAAAYWQPARAVGGDFYDFIELSDGRLGIVIADVTDKGVPAALVMATTRSILRSAAERHSSAGEVLSRVNNLLVGDIPRNMFVTCLYAILEPASGLLQYANAGHNLPYCKRHHGVDELRATGMPLGLLPEMNYEECETNLSAGESVLLYSDGLVEAHNPDREMFSFKRLRELVQIHPGGAGLVEFLLLELASFTGDDWEQEDDVTFVTLERQEAVMRRSKGITLTNERVDGEPMDILAEFSLPSKPGQERVAMEQIAVAVADLRLPAARLDRLKTAVSEATMNAIEHGNDYRAELPVKIKVLASDQDLEVHITDQGGEKIITEREAPDLEAKLAGLQSPRGWGLFLIKNMVDEMEIITDQSHHTIVLTLHLRGEQNANETA